MVFRRSVESHISPTGKMDCKLARKIEIKCALQSSCSFLWKGFIWKAPCQSRHLLSEWRAALSSGAARESQSLMQVLCRFSLPKSPKVPHKYMAPWMPCIVPFVRSVIDICKRKPHSICKQRADPEQAAMRPHRSKGIISVPLRLLPHCPRWIGFLLAPKLIFFLLECRYHYIRYLKKNSSGVTIILVKKQQSSLQSRRLQKLQTLLSQQLLLKALQVQDLCSSRPERAKNRLCLSKVARNVVDFQHGETFSGLVEIIVSKKLLHGTKQWLLLAQVEKWWSGSYWLQQFLVLLHPFATCYPLAQEIKGPLRKVGTDPFWGFWSSANPPLPRSSDFSSFSTAAAGAPSLLLKPWNLRGVSNKEIVKIHQVIQEITCLFVFH